MYTVRIIHEYIHGPIWVYGSDGVSVWEYPLIHNDAILAKLNEQAAILRIRHTRCSVLV